MDRGRTRKNSTLAAFYGLGSAFSFVTSQGVGGATINPDTGQFSGTVTSAILQATVLASPSLDIVSGNNQSGTPGTQLPQPLTVVLRDANGLPLADRTITWQVTSGTGTVSPAAPRPTSPAKPRPR